MRELTGWSKDLRVTADADDVVSGCVNPSWPRCSSLKWPHLAVGRSGSGCGGVGVTVAGAGVEGSEAEHVDEPAHRGVRSDSLVGEELA